jgi:lipoyltransferase/lipoate-protein ligase
MKYINIDALGRKKDSFFFALEEELLKKISEGEEYFFIWRVWPGVVIGRNQLVQSEVNEAYLKENNIGLFRRLSGGGCVYSDESCIKFTFITKKFDKEMIFKRYLSMIVESLQKLGLHVVFSGRNDILYEGKKFSGNAFYHNKYGAVLHGTILYDTNFEHLVKSITPSNDKLISKGIESVRQRVVNLKDLIKMETEEFTNYLVKSITSEEVFLTSDEIQKVEQAETKYLTHDWIYGKNPPYTATYQKRYPAGGVRVNFEIKNKLIKDIQLSGDYFSYQELDVVYEILKNVRYEVEEVKKTLSSLDIGDYIMGLTNQELLEVLFLEELIK